ncbi:TIGR04290 family methyltransferase [Pseudosulfitobacter koreensis]|uniref:TIGR04290 family methyltransferase n=1 Tax=Pseudosulfitobacter koreensis TaxID=2968472 RepID=A0ABT1YX21_9RHOB|nr:TIGR04290 family methyltransferase [Pseudosulfitobacter koreense]MCR8825414.1 TIGR04290 family methyltransferase [Pseudosulfitobacter koreense]
MDESDDLSRRIAELGPWFHNLRIGGIQTAPDHFLGDYPAFKWQGFRHVLPENTSGMSVLDIGCNAGFYALEMARRGASEVVAIDSDAHYLRQARFAAEQADADITFRQMSVYDVGSLGRRFDLVIFMGVFYHLRHPLLALDLLHEHVVGKQMLFQCMQRGTQAVANLAHDYDFDDDTLFHQDAAPRLHFIEHRFAHDPTNWFVPNRAATEAMLRSSGFAIEAHPEPEVYLCRREARPEHTDQPPRIVAADR